MKLIMENWRRFVKEAKNKEGKEQGADGKACWKGYKYAGTENGKDKCVPMEEEVKDTYDDEVENQNDKNRKRGKKELMLGEEELEESTDKSTLKCNQPRRTPNHPKKSHIVKACENGKEKIIRFGQQGVKTNQTAGQRKAFKSRHGKNIAKGKMSAAYWADKVKWDSSKTKDKDNDKWVKGS